MKQGCKKCARYDAIRQNEEPDSRTVCCGCLLPHRDGSGCFSKSLILEDPPFHWQMCNTCVSALTYEDSSSVFRTFKTFSVPCMGDRSSNGVTGGGIVVDLGNGVTVRATKGVPQEYGVGKATLPWGIFGQARRGGDRTASPPYALAPENIARSGAAGAARATELLLTDTADVGNGSDNNVSNSNSNSISRTNSNTSTINNKNSDTNDNKSVDPYRGLENTASNTSEDNCSFCSDDSDSSRTTSASASRTNSGASFDLLPAFSEQRKEGACSASAGVRVLPKALKHRITDLDMPLKPIATQDIENLRKATVAVVSLAVQEEGRCTPVGLTAVADLGAQGQVIRGNFASVKRSSQRAEVIADEDEGAQLAVAVEQDGDSKGGNGGDARGGCRRRLFYRGVTAIGVGLVGAAVWAIGGRPTHR